MRRPSFSRATSVALFASSTFASTVFLGCGYTEQEWQVQTDKYQRVLAKERAGEEKLDAQSTELDSQRARMGELEERLKGMGVDLDAKDSALNEMALTLADREKAIALYKLRTKQLEAIKTRFDSLRARLESLTDLGIEVHIRRNRMVISLPGDVLFDTGKDKVKKEGKDILAKVAAVIHDDPLLDSRDYQVAGNTDSKPLRGGNFGDNWGLSLMRARQVLLFLIDPEEGKLTATRWSAAGYADTDPVATNDTDEGRQKNRRCDLVILPSLDEMLDLRAVAVEDAAPPRPRGELTQPAETPKTAKPAEGHKPQKAAVGPATNKASKPVDPASAKPGSKSAKKPAPKN